MSAPSQSQTPGDPIEIVIADDDDSVRRSLVRLLERAGYRVAEFADARSAEAFLREHDAELLISDHQMPERTGTELIRAVRLLRPSTMRILLTGHADVEVAMSAINSGEVYRLLTKPWITEDLLLNVRLAIEHGRLQRRLQEAERKIRERDETLRELSRRYPGIASMRRDDDGRIIIDG